MEAELQVNMDGYWAGSQRMTGWERYSKLLVRELQEDPRGINFSVEFPRGRTPRLLWDQLVLPARRRPHNSLRHFPAAPPSMVVPLKSTVTTIHDVTFLRHPEWMSRGGRLYYTRGLKRVLSGDGCILTPSVSARTDLIEFGVNEDRVYSAVLGIDLPAVEALEDTDRYILFIGTQEPRKDIDTLLKAWSHLSPKGWLLKLVGRTGWGPNDLAAPSVELCGVVSDSALDGLIRGARAVVMPSLYEGFGLPVLESMARGTVVIASDIPAHREVGGLVPIYFPAKDADALSEVLDQVLFGSEDFSQRRWSGVSRASDFSVSKFADSVVAAYKAISRHVDL